MTIDPTHVLGRAQAAALALMVDTGRVRRKTGESTDPDTGIITPKLGSIPFAFAAFWIGMWPHVEQ